MSDPQAPIEIASVLTEFEGNALAELLRGQGIQAAVFGKGASFTGMVQECWDWRVMVPKEDAARARQIIVEARAEFGGQFEYSSCPSCDYSLAGLAAVERCPECGLALSDKIEVSCARGPVIDETAERPARKTRQLPWIGIAVSLGVGLLTFVCGEMFWGWQFPWFGHYWFDRINWARVFEAPPWWSPIPVALVGFAVAIVTFKRRMARRTGHTFRPEPASTSQSTAPPPA